MPRPVKAGAILLLFVGQLNQHVGVLSFWAILIVILVLGGLLAGSAKVYAGHV